jgi:DNA-binding SARP family transcriptional activator/ABC-type branched-subunit amino acid transport system substrate-binding protein/DNA-binding beta-propeller fold protein YncE
LEFGILGPLAVSDEGREVPLGGGKQRTLFALLLLHRNEVVSTDRLIDSLWDGHPTATAAKSVQVYVSQLRKVLDGERLLTKTPGYELRVEPGELDADRFESLVAEARRALAEGDPAAAARGLRDGFALWRGPPLADFAYDDFAQRERGRLEELRLAALEDRAEADLSLGRHVELAPELEALVREHPLRERLRAQLMLCLYRCGRHAHALEAYREGRRVLAEELGLEPGTTLQELERQILRHDPALRAAARAAPPRPPRPWRRRAALLLGAGLLAGSGISAAVLELNGPRRMREPVRNAVARIDGRSAHVGSYTSVGATPSNVAAGEGGVWVLNVDDRTISLVDRQTGRLVKTFETGGTPTELAVGAGAVWAGIGKATAPGPVASIYTAAVARIDPRSALVTRTIALPGRPVFVPSAQLLPVSQLAVGAGAVWAVNPDLTLSRIDPSSGRRVAVVDVEATNGIAAGREGVWVIEHGTALTRIDPRTNRPAQRVQLEASGLEALALGAGSVWASDPSDGLVWRVQPGPHPLTRSIAVAPGVAALTFTHGALWATDFVDGTVVRIDPSTNAVSARTPVFATPLGLAASGSSVWVTVAGATAGGRLPAACGALVAGGGRAPDVLIASDLPLQGPIAAVTRPMADAIAFVLREHGFRAGRFSVGYRSCDDSTAGSGKSDFVKCAANAKAYAESPKLVAVIGPYESSCADAEIPITNRLSAPLPLISPSNTRPGLTRPAPADARGEPASHYPTGVRSYFRVAAPDDVLGAGIAELARELGASSLYVLTTGRTGYGANLSLGVRKGARKLGLAIAGTATWHPEARGYAGLAASVARARPDAVVLADFALDAGRLIRALRARLGPQTLLLAGDGFLPVRETLGAAGHAALGMYVTFPGVAYEKLAAKGRRFARAFGATRQTGTTPSGTYLPEAAAAAEALLEAIARSDGTRASVLDALRRLRVANGILGAFRFDANGDMTPALVTALRITGRVAPRSALAGDLRGAAVDRIVKVPTALLSASGA